MKSVFLALISCFVVFIAKSQAQKLQTSVFFPSDVHELSRESTDQLHAFIDSISTLKITKIVIQAHADKQGDSWYNYKLSQRRGESVKHLLTINGVPAQWISKYYFGEDYPIDNGPKESSLQKNRRVVVTAYYTKFEKPLTVVDTISAVVAEIDTCSGDTTVMLPGGARLVFNKCDYIKKINCLDFNLVLSPTSALENNLSTEDEFGRPLASCGMIKFSVKPECPEMDCFVKPVTVLMPAPEQSDCDVCGRSARLFVLNDSRQWQRSGSRNSVKLIKIDDKEFYQLKVACPNFWANCDCRKNAKSKVRFKAPRGYELVKLTFTYECPTMVLNFKRKGLRKIITRIPCMDAEGFVQAKLVNSEGDTVQLAYQTVNSLKRRWLFSKCGKRTYGNNSKEKVGLFRVRKRSLYRKYIIDEQDLKPLISHN